MEQPLERRLIHHTDTRNQKKHSSVVKVDQGPPKAVLKVVGASFQQEFQGDIAQGFRKTLGTPYGEDVIPTYLKI